MATFYIQLQDKLLQISGELTAENISKALGYVPVDSSTMNNYATKDEVSDLVDMSMVEELSQRVDNITFDSLKDNPFLQDGSGELNIVDEAGNIIAKIDAEGIHSVDFITGEHRLSDKTDKAYVDEAIKNVKVDLTGYATEEWVENKNYLAEHQDISHLATKDEVSNIGFYNIKDNPIVNNGDGKLLFVDENGYIGLQLEEDGLYVKDVIADGHTLSSKADKSELPTKTSDLTNDSGFITINDIPEVEIPSLDEYVKSEDLPNFDEFVKTEDIPNLDDYAKTSDIPSLDGYATEEWVNSNNYATEEDLSSIEFNSLQNNPIVEDSNGEFNLVDNSGNIGFKVNQEGLFVKDVIAGNHVLSNKANVSDIPKSITESTVSNWGFTKNTGTYSKPSSGIPKDDLENAVQISLGKADTALQSYTEQYQGTVTGVKINGTTNDPSSGIIDLGYINKKLTTSTSSSMTLSPNVYYRNTSTSLSSLTITLGSVSNSNIINEYFVEFTTRSAGTTVSLPSTIKWANGEAPTFEAGATYQISIVNNLGVATKFN